MMLHAQSAKVIIKGQVVEKATGEALPGATIVDLTSKTGTVTRFDGSFSLELDNREGEYHLQFSFIGYRPVEKTIRLSDLSYRMGKVELESNVQKINEVIVKGKVPTATMKSDTISFNAEAVKVSTDSKGLKLIKKLPGFSVDKGKIETQGEQVKKVYLNGKPYFEDDPKNALNALPAEMIQNIELFDDYGDIAAFTGYASGSSVKAINIVTKSSFRNSLNGQYQLGVGTNDRYALEGSTMYSDNNHNLTFVIDANNINKSNSDLSDFQSFEQMVLNKVFGSTNDQPESFGEQEYKSVGLNYNGKISDNTELSLNYVFGKIEHKLYQNSLQNSQDVLFYNQNDSTRKSNSLNKLNLKLTTEPNENNKFILNQNLLLMDGDQKSKTDLMGSITDLPINYSNADFYSDHSRFSSKTSMIWLHKFKESGASLTALANLNLNNTDQDQQVYADFGRFIYPSEMELDTLGAVNDYNFDIENSDNKAIARISYKQPLSMLSSLNLVGMSTYGWRDGKKDSWQFNQQTGKYENYSEAMSSRLQSDYWTNHIEMGLGIFGIRTVLNLGLAYEHTTFNNENHLMDIGKDERSFQKVLPMLFGKYFISSNQNLVFFARSKSILPTVDQLQATVDVSNPLQVYAGNTNVKEGLQHIFMARYSYANNKTSKFLSAYAFFKYASDFVGTETTYLTESTNLYGTNLMAGTKLTQAVNLKGLKNIMLGVDYSLPLNWISSNLNLSGKYAYNSIPTVLEGVELNANKSEYGVKLGIVSNISNDIDFNISNYSSYNKGSNTENDNSTEYLKHNLKADLSIQFLKKYHFSTEYEMLAYDYLGEFENQNRHLLNVSLGRNFLKNDRAKLSLSVYDVLDQNKGVAFNQSETYHENIQSNALQQYVMLTFQMKL
jgi:hypothetical protein